MLKFNCVNGQSHITSNKLLLGLTLYPRNPPCMRYGLVSTESHMKSAVVLVTSLSGFSRNFCGISSGTTTHQVGVTQYTLCFSYLQL